jgi:bifunctional DNA-binding transcriptional regulator/antitoxin component of YhaV-PrlF toxin-antitoxin module
MYCLGDLSEVGVRHQLLRVRVDAKRRVALPGSLLDQVGFQPSTGLIAYVDSPGRIVIETPEAAVANASARIWADLGAVDSEYDATADVHEMRDEDSRIADANAAARSTATSESLGDGLCIAVAE